MINGSMGRLKGREAGGQVARRGRIVKHTQTVTV